MKDVFISTQNFQRFQTLYDELIGSLHGLEMGAVLGRAGRGKTTAAQRIVTMSPVAVYVRFCEWMTVVGIIREIAFAISGNRPRSAEACIGLIRDEMARQRRLVLLDEADRMSIRQLNGLRDFHDEFKAPVVLIGEEPLQSKLNQEGRLNSRVRNTIKFEPVSQADVSVFFRQALDKTLKSEHAMSLTRHSRGDFRRVVKDALAVERFMTASGLEEITDDLLRKVFSENGTE